MLKSIFFMSLTFASIIAQSPEVSDDKFWEKLSLSVLPSQKIDGKLTLKSKQKLTAAIEFAISKTNDNKYMKIIIDWIRCLSKFPNFLNNFCKTDISFYSALGSLLDKILDLGSDENSVKTDFICILGDLFTIESALKNELLPIITEKIIMIFRKKEEDNEIIFSALKFLFSVVQKNQSIHDVVKKYQTIFLDSIKSCKYPKIQLQFLHILWLLQIKRDNFNLIHDENQSFLNSIHKILATINNGKINYIITLQFVSTILYDGTKIENGWIDFGIDDMLICFDEQIFPVQYDAIDGLDNEESLIRIILSNSSNGKDSYIIEINLLNKPKPKFVSFLFARISHGQSQSQIDDFSESEEEIIKTQKPDVKKKPKSSIALYCCKGVNKIQNTIDECLFNEEKNDQEEKIKKVIKQKNMEMEQYSPPNISIEMINDDFIDEFNKKENEINVKIKNKKAEISENDKNLSNQTTNVFEKINYGIDSLTQQRMDFLNNFEQQLGSIIDSLHEDIKNTLRDREHGSIKQLELSKQQFQSNIQKFKRKESTIQQTLIGFEEESKQMGDKIVSIQKKIRTELQNHQIDLENELKRLKKLIRKNAEEEYEN